MKPRLPSVYRTALLGLLSERRRGQLQLPPRGGKQVVAGSDILLTGTQVEVQNALVAALLEPSALVVLTGAAGLGKTTILAAALAGVSNPWLQVIQLDGGECGMDESFEALFAVARHEAQRPSLHQRRMMLVADQAETLPSGTFAFLELLTRMPGKDAAVQLVIVGRPEFGCHVDSRVAHRFQDAAPVCLVVAPLSEQDAWDLFHHRVSSVYTQRSVRRLVMMLLERSGGLPGRFDDMLKAAVASGLLEGTPG